MVFLRFKEQYQLHNDIYFKYYLIYVSILIIIKTVIFIGQYFCGFLNKYTRDQ